MQPIYGNSLENKANAAAQRKDKQSQSSKSFVDNRPIKAIQRQMQELANNSSWSKEKTIQLYSIKEEKKSKDNYQVSDDQKIICGLDTPNHSLFVNRKSLIEQANQKTANSPLEFYTRGEKELEFDNADLDYYKFNSKKYFRINVKYDATYLEPTYQKEIIPKFMEHVRNRKGENKDSFIKSGHIKEPGENRWYMNHLIGFKVMTNKISEIRVLEGRLKKIAIQEIITTAVDRKQVARFVNGLLEKINVVLDNEKLALNDLPPLNNISSFVESQKILAPPPTFIPFVAELNDRFNHILSYLETLDEETINMLNIQQHAFNQQLEYYLKDNKTDQLALFKACDATAGLLGGGCNDEETKSNTFNFVNKRLKGDGEHHYAYKIMESDKDWVTMEGFAASKKEGDRMGRFKENFINLDNSWQYLMYGKTFAEGGDNDNRSQQERFFKLYTEIRYLLKGIKSEPSVGNQPPHAIYAASNLDEVKKLLGVENKEDEEIGKFYYERGQQQLIELSRKLFNEK